MPNQLPVRAKKVDFTFRLDTDQMDALKRIAFMRRCSVGAVAREAFDYYLNRIAVTSPTREYTDVAQTQ